jgi:hypothetical protein
MSCALVLWDIIMEIQNRRINCGGRVRKCHRRCPKTYGCIGRLTTFLNENRHVVGVEAGTGDGVASCLDNAFNDIVSSIASVAEGEEVELKYKMPLTKT